MSRLVSWIDRQVYPQYDANWDDLLFRQRIEAHLRPEFEILDVGAGAGIVPQMNFHGCVARVCGVDLDPRVVDNPFLDEGVVATAEELPFEDQRFDLVFSDNVLEHLADPLSVFREVHRVLKPGGLLLVKTPNRHHYVATIARWTPLAFHRWMTRLRGRAGEDTFPTLYRANSRRQIVELAGRSGLEVVSVERTEGRPEYLRILAPAYLLGALYERVVNSWSGFAAFRVLLIATLRRPS